MASIAEWIEKIKTAIYGEEVRGAIWQSLDAMNTQVDAINVDSAQIEQNKQDIATNTAAITALNSRTSIFSYYAITSADLTETNNPLTIADSFVLRSGADVAYVSIANNNNLVEYAPCGYTVYEIRHMNDSVIVNVFSYVNRHLYVNTRTRNGAWKGWIEIS